MGLHYKELYFKLDLYDKTTYKYTQEKNFVSNQYTLL